MTTQFEQLRTRVERLEKAMHGNLDHFDQVLAHMKMVSTDVLSVFKILDTLHQKVDALEKRASRRKK